MPNPRRVNQHIQYDKLVLDNLNIIVHNLFRLAKIKEVNLTDKTVNVQIEDDVNHESGFVPFISLGNSSVQTWNKPLVGDTVLFFCATDDTSTGFVLPSFMNRNTDLSSRKVWEVFSGNDFSMSYDDTSNTLNINVDNGGQGEFSPDKVKIQYGSNKVEVDTNSVTAERGNSRVILDSSKAELSKGSNSVVCSDSGNTITGSTNVLGSLTVNGSPVLTA